MQLSLSFVTGLIAAGVALAAPAPSPLADEGVLKVALTKRNVDLHHADSFIVDPAKVAKHISSVKTKYTQTLANLEGGNGKRAVSNIPLTAQQGGSFWSGNVQIGGQTLSIDFDTGSSDIVINQGAYTPSSSSTKTSKTFVNSYGTSGSVTQVRGTVYQDSFSSGSLKASKASVGLITSGGNVIDGADGLIGLAYPSISNYGSSLPPLFDTLISQNAVSSKTFGFALSQGSSELTLGGIDSTKYSGPITYTGLSRKAYWQVPATVNGLSFSSIVDSGTTLVIADTDSGSAQAFFKKIGVQTFTQDGQLYGEVDCNSPPTITFNYGGKAVTLSKDSSILGQTNSGTCVLSIVGTSVGQSAWITGDPVFLNSYIVFDRANDRVGFATRR
ncbi:unnamed protein product [Parajaminaea phylloscopi]